MGLKKCIGTRKNYLEHKEAHQKENFLRNYSFFGRPVVTPEIEKLTQEIDELYYEIFPTCRKYRANGQFNIILRTILRKLSEAPGINIFIIKKKGGSFSGLKTILLQLSPFGGLENFFKEVRRHLANLEKTGMSHL